MKKNILFKIIMLLVVATFSIYNVHAQITYGYGPIGGSVCTSPSTTGTYCTFIGCNAGAVNTGSYNSFFGDHSGFKNTSSTGNVFAGYGAGWYTTGGSNTFIGVEAGYYTTSPTYETFIGANAGFNNTTGGYNTILGYSAGYTNTTGGYNTLLGYQTGHENTTASYNLGIGHNALYYNQTGQYNTVIGVYAGQGATTNSYSKNNFIGYSAGFSNTTGTDNTANGYEALYSNTTGLGNTADGYLALYSNTTGGVATGQTGNTAVGYQSLYSNSTGGGNTASGDYALNGNNTGGDNTAFGNLALESNTTTSYNTAIGYGAGSSNATCDHSTFVGYGADANGNYSNATAIGNGATSTGNDIFYCGNANAKLYCALGVWTGSDGRFKFNVKEDVKGLEFINKLRPVTYQLDTKKLDGFINNGRNKTQIIPHTQTQTFTDSTGTHTTTTTTYDTIVSHNPNSNLDFATSTSVIHAGFVAQEVEKAAKGCGFNSSIVQVPADSNTNHYALSYQEIVVPLVKAVQELSKEVDSLKAALQPTGTNQRTINNNDNNNQSETPTIHNIELANNAILYQNAPNPFGDGTTIKYFVPDNADSQIIFYDEFGTQLKIFKIAENGTGQLNIDASNLAAGMYSYSLIVNGKVIDTKKMIRNK